MKLTKSRLKEIIEDELYNPQSDDATFKEGIIVKDINPNCPHHKSMGEVTNVSGKDVTYEVTNVGKLFKPGDELTKSKNQLIPLNSENIKSLVESKLRNIIKKELKEYKGPEKVAEDLVGVVDELRRQIKNIDFNKLREWAKKYHKSASGLLDMLGRSLKVFRKLK